MLPGAVLAIVVLATGSHVWADACAPPLPPAEALKNAEAVFVGKVTDVQAGELDQTVTFVVAKAWKGVKGREVVIKTAELVYSAAASLVKDMHYIVYSTVDSKGHLYVGHCSRTKLLAAAGEDLKELGKPEWEGK